MNVSARTRRPMRTVSAVLAGALLATSAASVAVAKTDRPANPTACANRDNNSYQKLLDCVTLDGIRQHQAALQAIADANGGTRSSGTPGYDQSVDYVAGLLQDAGYDVVRQSFEFPYFEDNSTLRQLSPTEREYADFTERDVMTFSGETATPVTASLQPVDVGGADSGCEASDFAGFTAGNIALIRRGTCSFAIKAANAEAAGAAGAIVFNDGATEGRFGVVFGTLGAPGTSIPVFGTTFAIGEEWVAQITGGADVVIEMFVEIISETRTTENVIATSTGGNPDNVVMAGAHLDSVVRGPGIQDNGTGSAALLEVALKLANHDPVNTLRFAWWGAEEFGLLGSEYYVQNLPADELDDIALYLNFDMIGSPNHVFFVYDADESSFDAPVPVPAGSEDIELVFERYYSWQDEPYDDSEFSGRSDYQEFINNGIPAGGLFTGAEVLKTPEQEAIWGGVAGDQYDPCYHAACDTFDNVNLHALEVNSDAVAFSVLTYAYSTENVNGVPGEPVPGAPIEFGPIDGPRLTNDENGGGGLAHDHAAENAGEVS